MKITEEQVHYVAALANLSLTEAEVSRFQCDLDGILEESGLDRKSVYITNAVKHFKWEPRGKRRLHKKPGLRELNACNVWLDLEIAEVAPGTIVATVAVQVRLLHHYHYLHVRLGRR